MIPDIGSRFVAEEEWLARYILRREHVRSDGTLKADPFMPYKWVELSVTRHLGLDEEDIWAAGEAVASETRTTLQGRADAEARAYVKQRLKVVPKPLPNNANHADVTGWPVDKPAQKEIALLIAREASFTPKPKVANES